MNLTRTRRKVASDSSWWNIWVVLEIQPSRASPAVLPQILMALKYFRYLVLYRYWYKVCLPTTVSVNIWLILGFVETWHSKFPASEALLNFSFRVFCPRLKKSQRGFYWGKCPKGDTHLRATSSNLWSLIYFSCPMNKGYPS